jgi:hypothetical protein
MSFCVRDAIGSSLRDANDAQLEAVLASIRRTADHEHADVALEHETGWALTYFQGGLLVFENIEDPIGAPRHMRGVREARALLLWKALAAGDLTRIEREPWLPGYGS